MKAEPEPKRAKKNRLAEFGPEPEDLRASGCTLEQIAQFENCKCMAEKLRFLQHHRDQLLDSIHEQEQQISTLDYLTYQMEKNAERGSRPG